MRRFGSYEVVGEAGRGGAGRVLRARGPYGDVAIKLVPARTRESLERFEREVSLLRELTAEDGFVPLLDAGRVPEGTYLVMPFVPGGTLRDRLARGRPSLEEAVALVASLAGALSRAHARGIIHRDLKPENVLFTAEGRPLIADLGLAKKWESDPGSGSGVALSVTGEFRGTAGYMAPEQLRDAKSAGPAADVFALGAILYECVVGEPAFTGDSYFDLLARTEAAQYVPVRSARADVPAWLAATITRALEPDPTRRYPDAAALEAALRAPPPPPRSRRPLVLAVLALAGVGAAAASYPLLKARRAAAPPVAPPPPVVPVPGPPVAPVPEPPVARPAAPPAVAPPPAPPPFAPPEASVDAPVLPPELVPLAHGDRLEIVGSMGGLAFRLAGPARSLAMSPDGQFVACIDGGGWLRVFDAATGVPRLIAPAHGGEGTCVAFAPDGKRLITGGPDAHVRGLDFPGGGVTFDATHDAPITALAWSGLAGMAASGTEKGEVFFLDPIARKASGVFRREEIAGPVHALAFTTDGEHVLAGFQSPVAWFVSRTSGTHLRIEAEEPVTAVAVSPDARTLALGTASGKVRVLDRGTKAVVNSAEGKGRVRGLAYAKERLLVAAFEDEGIAAYDLDRNRTVLSVRFAPRDGPVALACVAGSERIITGSQRSAVLLVSTFDEQPTSVPGPAGHVGAVRFVEPLGQERHVSMGSDRILRFWHQGEQARALEHHCALVAFAFAPTLARIFVADEEATILAIDPTAPTVVGRVGKLPSTIHDLAFDAARQRVVVAGEDGCLRPLEAMTLEGRPTSPVLEGGPLSLVRPVASGFVALAGERLHLVDAELQPRASIPLAPARPRAAGVDPTGRLVAIGGADGKLRFVRVDGGTLALERTVDAHPSDVTAVAISLDGTRVASGGAEGAIKLWDVGTGALRGSLSIGIAGDLATSLRFEADGSLLVGTLRGPILRLEARE